MLVDPSPYLGQNGCSDPQRNKVIQDPACFLAQLLTLKKYRVSLQKKLILDCFEFSILPLSF